MDENYIDSSCEPTSGDGKGVKDSLGHGTHVAGIAAAETDNTDGVAGVCWNCKIYVAQAFNKEGEGTTWTVYKAIKEAVDYAESNNLELVVNASLGFGGTTDCLENAVTHARDHDVPIVASAGNNNPDVSEDGTGCNVKYPAAYSQTYNNVVAVASTDHNDDWSTFSCTGSEVNVAAPGGYGSPPDSDDVFSTLPNYDVKYDDQNYGYVAGTSMAAPHVAGTLGLMRSVEGFRSPSDLRNVLENTAEDVNGGGFDEKLGHGRINAYSVVAQAIPAAPTNLVMTNAGQVGAHPNLDWDDNTEPDLDHYNVYRCTSHYTSCSWSKIAETTTSDYTDTFVIIKDKEDANDEYSYYVSAVDATDFESDPSNTVSTWGTQPLLRGPDQEDENPTPDVFALHAPAPNPAASQTTVQVDVPETKTVTVTVYDVMGRQVARLADRTMTPGFHPLSVHPDGWPSGVYFVRMRAGTFTATERLTVVR